MSIDNPYRAPQDTNERWGRSLQPILSHEIHLGGSMPIGDVLHTQVVILCKNWHIPTVCVGIYLSFVMLLASVGPTTVGPGSLWVGSLLILPMLLPITFLSSYLRLRRNWRHEIGLFAQTQSSITTKGIASHVAKKSFIVPWSAFERFLATDRVVILFLQDSKSHLIVSRAKLANPADWSLLLDFLQDRLPRA